LIIHTLEWSRIALFALTGLSAWLIAAHAKRIDTNSRGFNSRIISSNAEHTLDPRSQYNFGSLFCEKLRGAFPYAAAGSGDYYNFVGDI
jgi:hypothetical protein